MSESRRVVVATAGHVDHGKTALMRALTGTDTDRLPEEKRRGISIELGFAELSGKGVSFIDVPGHKKLVHAMIAGVGGVDAALLVVAADDAVMPQTREHLWVCKLLGIERLVVALTKADLVDAETLELAEADVRQTLEAIGLRASSVIATSVVDGRGIAELEAALLELAKTIPARAASARTWLPVDRVFSVKGAGSVVTGTLTRGSISTGDALWVAGERASLESGCRALEVHGHAVGVARAPTRVAVNLARVGLEELHRGDVITKDANLPRSRHLDVSLTRLPESERLLGERAAVVVHVGTTRVTGRVKFFSEGAACIALDHALPLEGGVGVVLRGFRATREHGAVLAGGRIVDAGAAPAPRKRDQKRREMRARLIEAAAARELGTALGLLLDLAVPEPIAASDVERRFGLEPGDVARLLVGKKRKGPADTIGLPGGELFTTARNVAELGKQLVRVLANHHAAHPHEPGAPLETVRSRIAARAGRELADLVVQRTLSNNHATLVDSATLALPDFAKSAGSEAKASAARVLELLETAALEGVSDAAIAARTGLDPKQVKSAVAQLASAGSARRLGGMWFAETALERLRGVVRDHFAREPSLSVPAFKEIAGVSRKQAIPLLEQLDREGTTRREGDLRIAGARSR